MSRFLTTVSLVAFVALAACNSREQFFVQDNTPADAIIAQAQAELQAGRGIEAADYFMEVERLYPYTPAAEQSLILAAQAYHDFGSLIQSRVAAERYLQYFPSASQADLAAYLVALSYYDGIVDVSRDQSRTFEALQALQLVIDRFPDSPYAEQSRPKFNIAMNQLAAKEMDIGRYYLQQDHFVAAAGRFKAVIEEYPINANTGEAYHRLIETYLRMGLSQEAQRVYSEMSGVVPNSEWLARSQSLITTGKQPFSGTSILRQIITGSGL